MKKKLAFVNATYFKGKNDNPYTFSLIYNFSENNFLFSFFFFDVFFGEKTLNEPANFCFYIIH